MRGSSYSTFRPYISRGRSGRFGDPSNRFPERPQGFIYTGSGRWCAECDQFSGHLPHCDKCQ